MWCSLCDIYQSWKPLEYDYRSVCCVQLWWEINWQILQLECFLSDSFEQTFLVCFYKAVFFIEENCFTVIIIKKEKKSSQKKILIHKTSKSKNSVPHTTWIQIIHILQREKAFCSTVEQCWTSLELKQYYDGWKAFKVENIWAMK